MSGPARDDPADEGGEPACWAHLVTGPDHDVRDRHDVERIVRDFYRQAAMDDLLGPVFAAARVDWGEHIATLVAFWSWQLLGERGYEGNPLRAHAPAHARTPFTPAHFDRWLELFVASVDEGGAGPVADAMKAKGHLIATAMRRQLDGRDGSGDASVNVAFGSAPPSPG
jgi:hemoglobin